MLKDEQQLRRGCRVRGCKPHKVILQNVYAKRFADVERVASGESRWEEGEHSLHDPIRDNTDKTSPEANLPHSSKTVRPFARYRRCLCDPFYPSYETALPSEIII